eukprot:308783_1
MTYASKKDILELFKRGYLRDLECDISYHSKGFTSFTCSKGCSPTGPTPTFPTIDYNTLRIIKTWQQYAIETSAKDTFLSTYCQFTFENIKICDVKQCGHKYFTNKHLFLQCLQKYMTSDTSYRTILQNHGIQSGFYNIFKQYPIIIDYAPKFLCFRSEFYNTICLMNQNPLFLQCLLLKSNRKCLFKIFYTFFIKYIRNTDIKQFIKKNSIPLHSSPILLHRPIITIEPEINVCRGFEMSFCCLASLIIGLLPHLKSYHIKYLFRKRTHFQSVAMFINSLLEKYCHLQHIRYQNEMQKPKRILFMNVKYWTKKHPILRRFIWVITLFYGQLCRCYNKTKKSNNKNNKFLNKLQKEINGFKYFMQYKKNINQRKIAMCYSQIEKMIWMEVFVNRNEIHHWRRSYAKIYMSCSFCSRKQSKNYEQGRKFKKCRKCKLSYYCNRKCQKLDWVKNRHKLICDKLFHIHATK